MSLHNESGRTVKVWDFPTRLFHWTLAASVAIAWSTGEGESVFGIHELAGYGVLALLLFRLVWGFAGGEYSRFSGFVRSWSTVRDYARTLLEFRPRHFLGHNPLGGWMVMLILATLGIGIATGMFAGGDSVAGPWAKYLSHDTANALTDVHEGVIGFLVALIVLHVGAVIAHRIFLGDNLVSAMITGNKPFPASRRDEAVPDRATTPLWRAVFATALAGFATWYLVNL